MEDIKKQEDINFEDKITKATYSISGAPWSLSIFGWFKNIWSLTSRQNWSIIRWLLIIYFGILGKDKAPVELTMIFSSNGKPGKALGSLPVAIIVLLALIV